MEQVHEAPTGWRNWRGEWALPVIFVIFMVGEGFTGSISANQAGVAGEVLAFFGFFGGALLGAFSVVRHAEELAHRFGEPYGTLILTISAITIEVVVIATIMLHGSNNPKIARDTMYSVVMIVLGGVVGFSLLSGGLRHHEQGYNLQGAGTFLSVLLPLAVLSLVWPNFTRATASGELSSGKAWFIMIGSVALYVIFLGVQTIRPRGYFTVPAEARLHGETAAGHPRAGWSFHAVMLGLCLPLVALLAEEETALVLIGLGALLWLRRERWLGIGVATISTAYLALLVLFVALVVFWTFSFQGVTSLNFFARDYVNAPFNYTLFQAANPLYILMFAPLLALLWPWLGKRGRDPSTPRKFGIGLLLVALSYGIMAAGIRYGIAADGRVGWWVLAACYLSQTIGELALSPIGYGLVGLLAAPEEASFAMGGWFFGIALAYQLAGWIATLTAGPVHSAHSGIVDYEHVYLQLFVFGTAASLLYLFGAAPIRKLMHGVH